jgi:hypothetical protein
MSKEEKKEEKAAKPARVAAKPARKATIERRKRRAAMPIKERPEDIRPSTVKGKIAQIQNEIEAIQIKKGEIQKGVIAFYEGVGKLYESMNAQVKENREAAAAILSGAQNIIVGIRALQSSINEKAQENADYVKNFYG